MNLRKSWENWCYTSISSLVQIRNNNKCAEMVLDIFIKDNFGYKMQLYYNYLEGKLKNTNWEITLKIDNIKSICCLLSVNLKWLCKQFIKINWLKNVSV